MEWTTARSFVSDVLLDRLAQPAPLALERHSLQGAVLLSDIASFTSEVERLVRQGPDGLERVISGFNSYFSIVADCVKRYGGDVLDNTGDSFLCLWQAADEQGLARATAQAGQAGLAILEAVNGMGASIWRTRIGIGAGPLDLAIVGGVESRWHLTPLGPAISDAVECERDGSAGTVLLSPGAATLLREHATLRDLEDGHAALQALRPPPTVVPSSEVERQPVDPERMDPMVPAPVRAWGEADHAWLSDFRRVNVVMVNLGPITDGGPLDLEHMHMALGAFQEVVARYDGSAKPGFDNKGVSFSGVFGLPPRAHPDNVDRALQAANECAARFKQLGIRADIGVSSGRVCCGVFGNASRREYALFGDAVNLASRLSTAGVEGVLIDEDTFHGASLALEVEGHRVLAVKNRSEPVRAYRLLTLRPAEVQARALVGREAERSAIDAALGQLIDRRQGSTIVVEGELGIGKSALARYAAHAAELGGAHVMRVSGTTIERGTPYRPWRPLLAELLEEGTSVERLTDMLAEDLSTPLLLPLLNPFLPQPLPETPETLALSGEARSEQLNALLSLGLRRIAENAPTVLIAEDVQWFDSMSWALLERVIGDDPLALSIVTERINDGELALPPERDELRDQATTQLLTLRPLSQDETTALVHEKLGTTSVDPQLLELVLERVIGHPFFCEASLEMMIRSGAIQVTSGGARLGPHREVGVPASIESAILGQFDGLSSAQQMTLKAAAVVGRSFRPDEVAAAHPAAAETDIPGELRALQEAGMLAPSPIDERYAFWHQIIQEVAYGVLTESQRQQTHRALARWYEADAQDTTRSRPELLAHHWMQSGSARGAAPYLEQAGRNALRAGAFREAVDLLDRAMHADPDVPAVRRASQEKALADAKYFLGDFGGSRVLLEQSLERLGYPVGITVRQRLRDLAEGLGVQAAHLARPRRYLGSQATDRETLLVAADAFRVLVQISYLHGDSTLELSALVLRSVNLAELAGPSAELSRALANVATLTAMSGWRKQGDRYAKRAIEIVADERHAPAAAYAWNILSILEANRGHWREALNNNGRALELFGEVGDTRLESEIWQTRAAVELSRGCVSGAETAWQRHRDLAGQTGSSVNLCWSLLDEAQTAFFRGDALGCAEAVLAALAIPVFDSDSGTVLERRTSEALAALAQGNHPEAASHARAVVDMLARKVPSGFHWVEFGADALDVLLEVRAAKSRAVPGRSLDQGITRGIWALRRSSFTFGGLATRLGPIRARAALQAGDHQAAQRFIEHTRKRAVRPDQRIELARAGLVAAELISDRGRRAEVLAEPMAVLAELGQQRALTRAQALL